MQQTYNTLKGAVEKAVGRRMLTPKDFDFLSARIMETTRQYLSQSTLKRFWGYLGEENVKSPRQSTLDVLARMAGYMDWAGYQKYHDGTDGAKSDFLNTRSVRPNSLPKGTVVQVRWAPDRKVTIRHEGYEVFAVTESINSKLCVGDTFRCGCIIDGEPMYLQGLIHNGGEPMCYICGREGGVKFRVIEKIKIYSPE